MQFLRKITTSALGGIPKGYREMENGDTRDLYDIFGQIESHEVGDSTFGEYVAYLGTFKAINLDTGEVYRSKKCLFPQLVSDALVDAVIDAEANKTIVEAAVRIGMRRTVKFDKAGAETGIGYEYTMMPLIPIGEADDPLAALEQRASNLLPAPTEDDGDKKQVKKPGK